MIKHVPPVSHSYPGLRACNRFLRKELSAIEVYEIAVTRFDDDPDIVELRQLLNDHEQSGSLLKRRILRMCGNPDIRPKGWVGVRRFISNSSRLFGEKSALGVRIKGEFSLKHIYQKALERDDLLKCCKDFIREKLLYQACLNEDLLKALSDRNGLADGSFPLQS